MDRSFLSDPAVVAATRDYVCVRTSTYEDEKEVPFLTSLFRGRSALLENTVFALLDPDGKTRISSGGRSPQMAFRTDDTALIVRRLEDTAEKFKVKTSEAPDRLPFAKSLRLGLNVAACDNQALVVCLADSPEDLRRIEQAVVKHAWSTPLLGQYHYTSSSKKEAAELIKDVNIDSGILVVQPGQFGTTGTILASHAVGDRSPPLGETLREALEDFDRKGPDHTRDHVREGKRNGIHWETATPITDSHVSRGREPARR